MAPFAVRDAPGFGKAAFASRPIRAGEVVISEAPLLQAPDGPRSTGARQAAMAASARGVDPQLVLLLDEVWLASEETRRKVLEDMYAPNPREHEGELAVTWARAAASLAASHLPSCAGAREDDLVRASLVWAMNSHTFHDCSALFEHASKLNHSCDANTDYHSIYSEGGKAYHVANRDIGEGEMLTTNYLQMHSLAATPHRRARLALTKLFSCSCSRCTHEADLFRRLPCPACAKRDAATGLLSDPLKFGHLDSATSTFAFRAGACSRLITCQMEEVEAGAAQPWHCAACAGTFADAPAALFPQALRAHEGFDPERTLQQRVEEIDSMMERAHEPSLVGMQRLYQDILAALGPHHWLLYKLVSIMLEYRCQDIKYKPMAASCGGSIMGSQLGSTPTGVILSDIERKAAMLWAWGTDVVQQRNFPHLMYAALAGPVEKLADAATAGWATQAERVRAAEVGANLCHRLLRTLGVEHRELDFQGFKCKQLLAQWGRLTKVVRASEAEALWQGGSAARRKQWRQVLVAAAPSGKVRQSALHLFTDKEELRAGWQQRQACPAFDMRWLP